MFWYSFAAKARKMQCLLPNQSRKTAAFTVVILVLVVNIAFCSLLYCKQTCNFFSIFIFQPQKNTPRQAFDVEGLENGLNVSSLTVTISFTINKQKKKSEKFITFHPSCYMHIQITQATTWLDPGLDAIYIPLPLPTNFIS